MPTLVPVISLSSSPPDRATGYVKSKGKSTAKLATTRRVYDDQPLPVAPTERAPQTAQIVGRTDPLDHQNLIDPKYTVKLGDVEIGDIGINEILDYVSALELEEFENSRFQVEAEVHEASRLAHIEEERRKTEERKLRVGRPKGVVGYRIPGEDAVEEHPDSRGREGRSRPTYKHLFKQFKQRQRRRRDPETGELVPLSDEEMMEVEESSADEEPERTDTSRRELTPGLPPVKRRRRKRDPVTGELLPLPPLASGTTGSTSSHSAANEQPVSSSAGVQKRQRRRRHPQTGELMPLGWKYDPARDDTLASFRPKSLVLQTVPAMKELSLSQEPDRKRRRLASEPLSQRSASPMRDVRSTAINRAMDLDSSDEDGNGAVAEKQLSAFRPRAGKVEVIEILESETDGEEEVKAEPPQKPMPRLSKTSIMQPTATTDTEHFDRASSASASSDHVPKSNRYNKNAPALLKHDSRAKATTSIMNPTAQAPNLAEESDTGDEELSEGEYRIERILAHHLSDPRTHPPDLGQEPVMLYKVKWVGWDKPTWEPVSSFADPETVAEYHRSVTDGGRT